METTQIAVSTNGSSGREQAQKALADAAANLPGTRTQTTASGGIRASFSPTGKRQPATTSSPAPVKQASGQTPTAQPSKPQPSITELVDDLLLADVDRGRRRDGLKCDDALREACIGVTEIIRQDKRLSEKKRVCAYRRIFWTFIRPEELWAKYFIETKSAAPKPQTVSAKPASPIPHLSEQGTEIRHAMSADSKALGQSFADLAAVPPVPPKPKPHQTPLGVGKLIRSLTRTYTQKWRLSEEDVEGKAMATRKAVGRVVEFIARDLTLDDERRKHLLAAARECLPKEPALQTATKNNAGQSATELAAPPSVRTEYVAPQRKVVERPVVQKPLSDLRYLRSLLDDLTEEYHGEDRNKPEAEARAEILRRVEAAKDISDEEREKCRNAILATEHKADTVKVAEFVRLCGAALNGSAARTSTAVQPKAERVEKGEYVARLLGEQYAKELRRAAHKRCKKEAAERKAEAKARAAAEVQRRDEARVKAAAEAATATKSQKKGGKNKKAQRAEAQNQRARATAQA